MTLVATTLNGADLLNLGSEAARIKTIGLDAVHFEMSTGRTGTPGPFGEFLVANFSAWTNLCMSVHLTDAIDTDLILNNAACGADILTLPTGLLTEETISLVHSLGLLCGVSLSVHQYEPRPYPFAVDILLFTLPPDPYPSEASLNELIGRVRDEQPDIAVGFLVTASRLSPSTVDLLAAADLVILDAFQIDDPQRVVAGLQARHRTPHEKLDRCISGGLKVPRDMARRNAIFASLDARPPTETTNGPP